MTRVVVYVRVSTDLQAEEGVSLDLQRERCADYARLYGHEVVGVFEDAGLSAKSLDRPGLQDALAMLRSKKADGVLVYKLDRLTRSVADLGTLIRDYFPEGKHRLMAVCDHVDTASAAGRLILNVLASVSQWEREVIGERTRAAMRHKAARGEYIGGEAPYGYRRVETRLEPVLEEQEAIAAATAARASGARLSDVVRRLTAAGFKTRKGTDFAPIQVARILRRAS